MQQYQKLEELTHKLDALNPNLAGGAKEALEGLRAKIAPHGAPKIEKVMVSSFQCIIHISSPTNI